MRVRRFLLVLSLACWPALSVDAGPPPSPPAPPQAGFGAPPTAYERLLRGSIANPLDASLRVHWVRPAAVAPAGAERAARVPVVLFLHGFGSLSPAPYDAWLEHMARAGAVVIYPVYPALEVRGGITRYDAMWAGFQACLEALESAEGTAPDLSRLGVVGHSFGGGAAPAMAARAAARGYGSAALWIECLAPWYDLDRSAWAVLPAHACLLSVAFSEDGVCDPGISATFPRLATTLPESRKAFLCFHGDSHGTPRLHADHLTPLTSRGVDALDSRGLWRLDDAFRAFATTGSEEARKASLGGGPEATGLGAWSDGTPVAPATTAWPTASSEARFSASTWRPGGKQEELMRKLMGPEAHSALPLPAPVVARASKLPESERFVRDVPPDAASVPPVDPDHGILSVKVYAPPDADAAVGATLSSALKAVQPKPPFLGVTIDDRPPLREGDPPLVLVYSAAGKPVLFKRVDDPNLAAAIADLWR